MDTTVTTIFASTTTTPPTVPPGSPEPSAYSASFSPCSADGSAAAGSPCDETPQQIQVLYPTGAPPDEVTVDWDASGRADTAPDPDSTSVDLSRAAATDCGTDLICWPWPSSMTDDSFILNGTYQVTICPYGDYVDGGCSQGGSLPPQSIGLAVPPDPPASVTAADSGGEVTVQWSPPTQSPPDLVGYTVTRNGAAVYTCSTDGLGPGSSDPCPQPLEVVDHPGEGQFTYAVAALRLGTDSQPADVVASSATPDSEGGIAVPAATSAPSTTSPPTGPAGTSATPGSSSATGRPPSTGGSAGSPQPAGTQVALGQEQVAAGVGPGSSPPIPSVTYPASVGAAPKHDQALALRVDSPPGHSDVVPEAVLALGILCLAVAAHFLYLRVELGVVQARLAARRAGGP